MQVCRPGSSTRQGQGNAEVEAEEAGEVVGAAERRPWGDTPDPSATAHRQTSCNQRLIQYYFRRHQYIHKCGNSLDIHGPCATIEQVASYEH